MAAASCAHDLTGASAVQARFRRSPSGGRAWPELLDDGDHVDRDVEQSRGLADDLGAHGRQARIAGACTAGHGLIDR